MAGIVSRPPSFGEADGRHDGSTHESGDIGSADLEHVPNNRLLERKQHRAMAISNPSDPLGRADDLALPDALRYLGPVAAGLFLLAARTIWGFGVRHYQSTGS